MLNLRRRSGMYLVSFAAVPAVAGAPDASAQQKLTYEQAFARCKADVVRNTPGETTGSAARYTRGLSCMQQYGYRLKEGASFDAVWAERVAGGVAQSRGEARSAGRYLGGNAGAAARRRSALHGLPGMVLQPIDVGLTPSIWRMTTPRSLCLIEVPCTGS